jgi:adenylate cyclase
MMMEVTQLTGQSLIWDIRVGINTGPAIGGVIGKSKFAFDIWGSSVNIGSLPGKVNISETTYQLVKDFFETEYRGSIEVKHEQKFDMYFLHRIKKEYSDRDGVFPNERLLRVIEIDVSEE